MNDSEKLVPALNPRMPPPFSSFSHSAPPQRSISPRSNGWDELAGVHLVLTKMPAKNVIFAAGPLAPYPDMELVPGRSHMNRCEII